MIVSYHRDNERVMKSQRAAPEETHREGTIDRQWRCRHYV